jgi:hypothetical protein
MTTRAKKGEWLTEPFVMHTRKMLESPAWCALTLSARHVLDRIEIEMMSRGGDHKSNGRLTVTYDDFERHGVHRHAIKPALAELEALGFLVKTIEGRGGNAAHRRAHQFRLTYFKFREGGTVRYRPTNEWRGRAKTVKEAKAIAQMARDKATQTPAQRLRKTTSSGRKPTAPKTFPSGRQRHSPVAGNALQNGGSQWQATHCSPVAGNGTTSKYLPCLGHALASAAGAACDGSEGSEPEGCKADQPDAEPVQVTNGRQRSGRRRPKPASRVTMAIVLPRPETTVVQLVDARLLEAFERVLPASERRH